MLLALSLACCRVIFYFETESVLTPYALIVGMSNAQQTNTAAIVVTYFPDELVTVRIQALLMQFSKVFVVDNSAPRTAANPLELLHDDRIHIRLNSSNLGLATALNQGMRDALDHGYAWGVTFDQDTLASQNLLETLIKIQNSIGRVRLIIGSNYHDVCRGKLRSVCQALWQTRKTVITSGMLFPLSPAQHIGGFRDDYFIDSVDHEFCLRARAHNFQIAMSCDPLMEHTIGNVPAYSIGWLRNFMPYNHPPQRKYYMIRNTLRTVGLYWSWEPLWCLRQLIRLNVEFAAAVLFEDRRREKLAACITGLRHALQGRAGPLDALVKAVNSQSAQPELVIMGVHQATEGYPNTMYRLKGLHDLGIYQITEICTPMKQPQWAAKLRGARLVAMAFSAILAHLTVLFRYASLPHRHAIFYVPYPAIFILAALSWLPRRFWPGKVIADAFISIHETLVHDRKVLKKESLLARAIFALEKRAYHYADAIITDTPQNAIFLQTTFGLPAEKLTAIPLSTNEIAYQPAPYSANENCRILFIGTMIPLHGVNVIIQAAALLATQENLHFRLIGDGQVSPDVELATRNLPNIEWERAWQSPEQLAEEIRNADICLGIFGKGDKAQRVCPLKIYAYATVGRAIITGETAWLTEAIAGLPQAPFAAVPVNDAAALAAKIIQLAKAPMLRANLAANSRQFYENQLSNQVALKQLVQVIDRLR